MLSSDVCADDGPSLRQKRRAKEKARALRKKKAAEDAARDAAKASLAKAAKKLEAKAPGAKKTKKSADDEQDGEAKRLKKEKVVK